LFVLLFLTVAEGQVSITGKITGVVSDASGAALPAATVSVTSSALMAPRSMQSHADGSYLFDLLPPGTYELTATAKGFKTIRQTGIVINAGFTATVNAKLPIGEVKETVTVTGEPVVDVKTIETDTTFTEQLLQDIPAGRDPWSTVAQMPGATLTTFDVGGNQSMQQSGMQVHGSTQAEQVFSFNGLDLNWPGANGGYTQFYTNHDSFQEFQVVSDNTPGSVSISGIYMNMVTKSGSNTLHGNLGAYYSTGALEAGTKFPTYNGAEVRAGSPTVMVRDTTASLGGPIIRDRWWLFGSYRRYDLRSVFLAVTDENGNPIADPNHQTNTDLRSDWQLNSRNKLSFIWLYNEQNRFFRRDSALVSPEASWRQIEPAYILQALWTSQITNNLLIDVRAGYNKEVFPLGPQPEVQASDFNHTDRVTGAISGAAQSYFSNPAWVFKIAAGASLYKGSLAGTHNFKFGFEWGDNYNPYIQYVNQGINAFYDNGVPVQVTAFNTPFTAKSYFRDTSAYAQDTWTIRRRFTLNLGLRYDRFVGYYPTETSSPNLVFPDLFEPTTYPASGNIVTWNNVSPRVGLAVDLTGRGTSVLRLSYGRFYKMEGTGLIETVNPIGFSSKTFTWNDANGDKIPQESEWKVGDPIAQTGGAVGTHIDRNLSRPYSDAISVNYEHQVWQDLRLGVAYYFRKKKNLFGTTNLAALPSDYTPVTEYNDGSPILNPLNNKPLTLYNLDPTLVGASNFVVTNISALDDNAYHGVEFTAVKRLSHRWQVLAGFTIQRQKGAFGRGFSDDATSDNFNDPNNDINRGGNYLSIDSTYIFKVDSSFDLPWKLSTSVNFQHYTGYPIQPIAFLGGDTFPDPANPEGPPLTKLNQGSEQVILQPAGIVRLPSVNLLNVRIAREFKVRERVIIKPLIDLFNLANRQTVISVNGTLPSSFGDPGSTYLLPFNTINPFIARVGLKIDF
jgi:outer membrane receptor protein involved in Fe transport